MGYGEGGGGGGMELGVMGREGGGDDFRRCFGRGGDACEGEVGGGGGVLSLCIAVVVWP